MIDTCQKCGGIIQWTVRDWGLLEYSDCEQCGDQQEYIHDGDEHDPICPRCDGTKFWNDMFRYWICPNCGPVFIGQAQ
jgi:rubredoxin